MSRPGTTAPAAVVSPELAPKVWSLYVDQVTATIAAQFEAGGIAAILLKGPGFARLLYDGVAERTYNDTDLLIRERDRARAEQMLQETGFHRLDCDIDWLGPGPKYAHTFRRLSDGAAVDLHWRLSGTTALAQDVWSLVSEHTTRLAVGGKPIETLDAPATALLVALHNAHHGTGRPRTLEDLDRAVERFDLPAWRAAARMAELLGASEPFAAGLRLTSAGDVLATRLGLERHASLEIWLKSNPHGFGAFALDRLASTSTLRGRLGLCMRLLVPSRRVMYKYSPLARRGRLGLALAYLTRPVRLAAHAGPALVEWVRARQALRAQSRVDDP